MILDPEAYNTQREKLSFSEYGRNVQKMVEHVVKIEDTAKRNQLAKTIVAIMANLNPGIKEYGDFQHKLWDHIHAISDFTLDVEGPFPAPARENLNKKPDALEYPTSHIKFRYYGRNVQNMIKKAADMAEGPAKTAFINMIASFMKNSSKAWNDEILLPEQICEHLETISDGKLKLTPEDLILTAEVRSRGYSFSNYKGNKNFRSNNNNNRGMGNNRNNNNKRDSRDSRDNNNFRNKRNYKK